MQFHGAAQAGRYFHLRERGSTFSTEIRAGIVCFLTVSWQQLRVQYYSGLFASCIHKLSCDRQYCQHMTARIRFAARLQA